MTEDILVPFIVFSAAVAIAAFILVYRLREVRLKHETIRLALEKGQPLPEGLLKQLEQRQNRTPLQQLKSALILLALAGAFIVNYYFFGGSDGLGFAGTILGLIGAVNLFIWYIDPARKAGKVDE